MRADDALEPWFTPRRFAALAGCIIAACFIPVLLGSQTFFFRDYSIFSYPLAAYHRECFWRGEIPLWNPYHNAGLPFLAQWNTMVFYPLSLIYLLLPLPWSLSFFCLFHLFLGGLGMYFLARHWTGSGFSGAVAGMAFMFNGVLLSCLKWPNNMAALGWMPWVVLATDKALSGGTRPLAIAALAGATQMLSGAPEVILLTWLFLGCWMCFRFFSEKPRRLGIPLRFGILALLIAGLSAVQLAPFLDLLQLSQRDATFAGSEWPMPILGWANFLLPLFQMFPSYHGVYAQPGQYWISTYYVSIAVVLLALSALFLVRNGRTWLLAALLGFVMWMALGEAGLLYAWTKALPGVSMLRFPIKFVVLAAFILPLLGAWGIQHLTSLPENSKLPRVFWILGGTIALGICGLWILVITQDNKPPPWISGNAAGRVFFLAASVGCLAWLARTSSRKHIAAGTLLLLIVIDGLTHAPWQNPSTPAWVYSGDAAEMEKKPSLGQSRAFVSPEAALKMDHLMFNLPAEDVMAARLALFQNVNLLEHIPKVDGFYALYPRATWDLHKVLYRGTNLPPAALLDFLGITQMTAPGSWSKWQTRTNSLPLISSPEKVLSADRPLEEMLNPAFNPRREVMALVGNDLPATLLARAEIRDLSWQAERIAFSATSPGPSVVVVAQTFYPWWKAYVDGEAVKISRVNHSFQAVPIPAGNHSVLLRYEDRAYKFGGFVSIGFSCIVTGLILFGRTKTV